MSNMFIRRVGGEVTQITPRTLSHLLGEEADYPGLVTKLIYENCISITTVAGERAEVFYEGHDPQPELGLPGPLQGYAADTRLLIELPAQVSCRATSIEPARDLIESVLLRATAVPDGFTLSVAGLGTQTIGEIRIAGVVDIDRIGADAC